MTDEFTAKRIDRLRMAKLKAEALHGAALARFSRSKKEYDEAIREYQQALQDYVEALEQQGSEG